MSRPDPALLIQTLNSWPPIAKAISRMTARKDAVVGEDTRELVEGRAEVQQVLRAMLSGTDIPLQVFAALAHVMVATFGSADMDEEMEFVINGLTLDAFLLGFWTHEAMQSSTETTTGGPTC
jgi:hypothetical protein